MQYAVLVLSDGSAAQRNTRHKEIERTLGLEPGRFGQIIHALCEDLLMGAHGSGGLTGSVDDASLASLMAEVACLPLQRKVLTLAAAAAEPPGRAGSGGVGGGPQALADQRRTARQCQCVAHGSGRLKVRKTMETLTLILGSLALTLLWVTFHAWRIGNDRRDVALLGTVYGLFGR
jgi:hypothetical protein